MPSDREKIRGSFSNHVDMFSYDEHGNITGLNHDYGLVGFAQSKQNLNTLLIGICTMFDFDRTRAGDNTRDTQMRIGDLIEAEGSAGDEAGDE
ncbi:hypothetical protein TSOC_015226 [Tetrabaena socialis]|uniref:Uncharacterized protein n=1 Tax=Tetrabaena socialis TaxID=47790 RepID=A0A2J7ZFF5_9CHLO|nr:hypothetical protein TSOC_015226 [Tetrabaena socialis]|eukprot:PNG99004.1 hypothetical protein TSOC_015226 [Tetrabaena socialis]